MDLPAPGRSDDADGFAVLDLEGDAARARADPVVREGDVDEGDQLHGAEGARPVHHPALGVALFRLLGALDERHRLREALVGALDELPRRAGPEQEQHDGSERARVVAAHDVQAREPHHQQQVDEALVHVRDQPRDQLGAVEVPLGVGDQVADAPALRLHHAEHLRLFDQAVGLCDPARVADLGARQGAGVAYATLARRAQQREQQDRRHPDQRGGDRVEDQGGDDQHGELEASRDQLRGLRRGGSGLPGLPGEVLLQLTLAVLRLHGPGGAGELVEEPRARAREHVRGDAGGEFRERDLKQQADAREHERDDQQRPRSRVEVEQRGFAVAVGSRAPDQRCGGLRDDRERGCFGERREDRAPREQGHRSPAVADEQREPRAHHAQRRARYAVSGWRARHRPPRQTSPRSGARAPRTRRPRGRRRTRSTARRCRCP